MFTDSENDLCEYFFYKPINFTGFRLPNFRYVFPVQFTIGTVTNLLNIIVLTRKDACTKTNIFLAAMSLADLLFFLIFLPITLAAFAPLASSQEYVWFWYHSSRPIMWAVNGLTTASIWYVSIFGNIPYIFIF